MNVEMIKNGANHAIDMEKTKYGNSVYEDSRTKIHNQGYSLDITGKVRENAAYGKEDLKSASELTQAIGAIDVTMQRDYMAVMSNSMSEQDFAKLLQDGVNPTDTKVEEIVTNLDKIKIELAKSGTTILGFNDNLSDAEIEAAAGSAVSAAAIENVLKNADVMISDENVQSIQDALEIASDIKPFSSETICYMVNNNLEPTVDNAYRAQYCAGVDTRKSQAAVRYDGLATYAGAADADIYWHEIADQARAIVDSALIDDPDTAMQDARWLVEHQVPLTKENLIRLGELKSVTFPLDEKKLVQSMAAAISDGYSAKEAGLIDPRSTYEKAADMVKAVESISNEAVDATVRKQQPLNIRNLLAQQQNLNRYEGKAKGVDASAILGSDTSVSDRELIGARRLLEETRLYMSCEANLVLIRKGISIDTKPLEELVSQLKKAEASFYEPLLNNTVATNGENSKSETISETQLIMRVDLYKQTMAAVGRIKDIPAETVPLTIDREFTISALDTVGAALKANYIKAGKFYESMMTTPRADMGDTMSKAFRNIDDILTDLGVEVNDDTVKSVKILGYSGMQINRENIERITDARRTVEEVLNLLSPARTLKLIRQGHNPMNEDLYSLRQNLTGEDVQEESESYSRFLLRIENTEGITEAQKDAYIGMFRLYRQIQKQDMRAVGNVISQGAGLTLSNLLKAARTNRRPNIDVTVDEEFGMLEMLNRDDSITDQISKGFAKLINPMNSEIDKEYTNEKMADVQKALHLDECVTANLERFDEVTVDNILAMNGLMNERGSLFNKLLTPQRGDSIKALKLKESLAKKAANILDKLTDYDSANESVQDLASEANAADMQVFDTYQEYTSVKSWKLLHRQIALCTKMAHKESYEVPIKIKEGWSSIHLEIVHNANESPRVEASLSSKQLGPITAVLTQKGRDIDAMVVTNTPSAADILKEGLNDFAKRIEKDGKHLRDLRVVNAKPSMNAAYAQSTGNDGVKSSDLYSIAKSFIQSIAGIA